MARLEMMRKVRLPTGQTLTIWDTDKRAPTGQYMIGYELTELDGVTVLFSGDAFGVSPMHAVDSDQALAALLSFLTLRPGDTDREYFDHYTPAQMAWTESRECEQLSCDVSICEEEKKFDYLFVDLDGE